MNNLNEKIFLKNDIKIFQVRDIQRKLFIQKYVHKSAVDLTNFILVLTHRFCTKRAGEKISRNHWENYQSHIFLVSWRFEMEANPIQNFPLECQKNTSSF